MNTCKNLLIVHHTQSGDTKKMTDAIIYGSERKNLNIRSLSALRANSNDLCFGLMEFYLEHPKILAT